MPSKAPGVAAKAAEVSSAFSEMRLLPDLAKNLSAPKRVKLAMLKNATMRRSWLGLGIFSVVRVGVYGWRNLLIG